MTFIDRLKDYLGDPANRNERVDAILAGVNVLGVNAVDYANKLKQMDMKDFGIMRASEAIEKATVVKEEKEIKKAAELDNIRSQCIKALEENDWVCYYAKKAISGAISKGEFSIKLFLCRWEEGKYVSAADNVVAGLIYVLGDLGYDVGCYTPSDNMLDVSWSAPVEQNVKI